MYRKPRWLKKAIKQGYIGKRSEFPYQNVTGIVLCGIGVIVILKAIPGWLYFVLAGVGFLLLGLSFMRE